MPGSCKAVAFNQANFPPGDFGPCQKKCCHNRVLLLSSGLRLEILLKVLQCSGEPYNKELSDCGETCYMGRDKNVR